MSKVSIIGAGGHTRTLINILELNKVEIDCIYDEMVKDENEQILTYKVRKISDLENNTKNLIISKGDIDSKKKLQSKYKDLLYQQNIIHPNALIESKEIGKRNQISASVYVTPTAKIGDDNIVYSGTVIEHEVIIGDSNIITVNVTICGRVEIEDNVFLGANSTILPNIKVCSNVIIGAGAVVTKDIKTAGTYIGIPAKKIK